MTDTKQKLQVGGTVDPKRYLYIERPEDDQVLNLLLAGEFVNILTSRQMGKSSLMVRTARALHENGFAFATIDLAGELGSQNEPDAYFLGLLNKISRDLHLDFDLKNWWQQQDSQTINQRLLAFFRNVLPKHVNSHVVIFLDEIDSTLKLPFTDDLFTVLRTIYNERSLVAEYQQVGFCLLGVATPDELVKDRRTTPYNIGKTIELRDFDAKIDDLSPLIDMFVSESMSIEKAEKLVKHILHWTGGQPYLTMMLCADVKDNEFSNSEQIDRLISQKFASLDQVKSDSHFQQVLRFVDHRFSDGLYSLELYEKVLNGEQMEDQSSLPFFELRLSGLVKRDQNGVLKLRNNIYQQLFDQDWINSTQPRQELEKTTIALEQSRKHESRANIFSGIFFAGLVAVFIAYRVWYAPQQQELQVQVDAREQLAQLNVAVVADQELGFEVLELPWNLTQAQFEQTVLLGKSIEQVAGVRFNQDQSCNRDESKIINVEFMREHKAWQVFDLSCTNVTDLSPLSNLTVLRSLDLNSTRVSNISSLANLNALQMLDLSYTQVSDLSPLTSLNALQMLDLSYTQVSDLSNLANLTALQTLHLGDTQVSDLSSLARLTALQTLNLNMTQVSDLSPLANLTALQRLDLSNSRVSDLSSLTDLIDLQTLYLGITHVSDLSPLTNLTALQSLYLNSTQQVSDLSPLVNLTALQTLHLGDTQVSDLSPLANLNALQMLELSYTQVSDLSSLVNLTALQRLNLSNTQVSDLLPLVDLGRLDELNIEATKVTQENLDGFLNQRTKTRANLRVFSDFDKSQKFEKDTEFEQQIQQQLQSY